MPQAFHDDLADNVEFTLSVLADDVGPYALALGVGLGLAVIVSAATGRFSLRSFKPVQFLPLGVVAVATAGQLYSSTSAKIDPISTRYFAPYYPLVWISLLAVTYAALPKTGLIWSRTLSAIALSAGIAASLYAAVVRAEMLINANVSERCGLSGTFAKLNPIIDKVHNVIGAEIDRKDHVDIAFVHPKYSSVSAAGIALNNETFPADANCSLLELAPTLRDRTETIAAKFHCKLGERRVDVTALLAQQFSRIGDDPDLVIMQKPWSEDRPTEIDALVENEGYSVAIEHPSLIVLRRHDR